MKKSLSIIAAAALSASFVMAGAVNSFAEEEAPVAAEAPVVEAPAEAPTEAAPTEAPAEAEDPAVTTTAVEAEAVDVTTTRAAQGLPASVADAKVFDAITKEGDNWEDFEVTGETYDIESETWTVNVQKKDGTDARVYTVKGDEVTRVEAPVEETTTTAAATTTTTTTTTAAKTTKAANKNSSPKTGDAFPALPVAGMGLTAVAVAFALRKKND
ncbi:MAG: LPXTG cell wall anchor domain-containing protein [Ruminococcus sp.]|nr:LPXTG cell wall anchor domain-containing protein [Ruminococcus sp.]